VQNKPITMLTGNPSELEVFTYNGIRAGVAWIHTKNVEAGWWSDLKTGERKERNVGELLCLVHSEISEAMEGHRKGLKDDKLPHRPMLEVELADAVIRIFDIAGGLKLDLAGALVEKVAYNSKREDHKIETRKAEGGKAY
jgi:NTP pyrophosphatase (non-canonical NTP hydrolase)